jgi:hypothetical protein
MKWTLLLTLVLFSAAWLAGPASASGWGDPPWCPCPHYSCLHYTVPTLYRWAAYCKRYPHYPMIDHFPEMPLEFRVLPYPCPGVTPALSAAQYEPPLLGDRGPGAPKR